VTLKMPPQLLRAALRTAVPWKNGGGLTREVVAAPDGAALGDFDWRISTAEVRSPGPFSLFPGVQRTLCVLEGVLALEVEGARPVRLAAASAPYLFSGDIPAHACPDAPGVVDLNVMTRRARFAAQVVPLAIATGLTRELAGDTALVFACTPLTVTVEGTDYRLARWDALQVTQRTDCTFATENGPGSCYLIEVVALARQSRGALPSLEADR
jgi:uncharacterized protein